MKQAYKILGIFIALVLLLIFGTMYIRAVNPQLLWYMTRASGITSYIILFLITMTGMGIKSGFIYNFFGPVFSWRMHRAYGICLIVFVLIHIVTLAFDATMNFSLADLFIPFHSQFSPLYLSMGIIGFYLFIAIIITSLVWVVKNIKPGDLSII